MHPRRRSAAFTLAEMMIAMTLSGVLAGIIYLVSAQGLGSFARNVSINRSYTDARLTIDRIAQNVATAGHMPVLIDATGATPALTPTPTPGAATPTPSPAAGIRFYRASPAAAGQTTSTYKITAGSTGPTSSNNTITIQLAAGQSAPQAKDVVAIPALGYQGVVSSVATPAPNSSPNYVLTMTHTLAADSSPAPTTVVDYANPTPIPSPTPVTSVPPYQLQSYTQVAYVVVGNQLRYYPRAKSVAVDGTTVFNDPANYKVVANLATTATDGTGQVANNTLLPFTLAAPPTVTVQLFSVNPDYTNRNNAVYNAIGSANTYTFMQSSLGPRSPTVVRGPNY